MVPPDGGRGHVWQPLGSPGPHFAVLAELLFRCKKLAAGGGGPLPAERPARCVAGGVTTTPRPPVAATRRRYCGGRINAGSTSQKTCHALNTHTILSLSQISLYEVLSTP